MSNNNKGKFSERLKKMKLYRIAKHKKMIIKNGKLVFDFDVRYINNNKVKVNNSMFSNNINLDNGNNDIKVVNRVKTGLGVGVALGGAVISNVIDDKVNDKRDKNEKDNITFDNDKLDKESINLDSKNIDVLEEDEELSIKDKINNGIKTGMGVGVALGGAVISNLIGISNEKDLSSDKDLFSDRDNANNVIPFKNNDGACKVYKVDKDYVVVDKISDKDIKNGDRKTYLAIEIMKKMKKEYDKKLCEIDVLESELFLLEEKNREEKDLEKCREIKKEINNIIEKINHIIEQYNIYKSHNFELDMLDIDDKSLVDDISDFKRLYEDSDIKRRLVSDYELINKYQDLYYNLNNIKNQVDEISKENNTKIDSLYNRDKKIDGYRKDIGDLEKINKETIDFIYKQNEYLDDISKKVGNIDVSSITRYKLRGFGDILSSSVRYIGLLSLSPLTGRFPSIALNIMASRYMLHNLYNALTVDEITTTIYKAQDFQNDISSKLNDLNYNIYSLNDAKGVIKDIRVKFMEQFNYEDSSHIDMLKKINLLENNLENQETKQKSVSFDNLKK